MFLIALYYLAPKAVDHPLTWAAALVFTGGFFLGGVARMRLCVETQKHRAINAK
jgi:hypothetical protein